MIQKIDGVKNWTQTDADVILANKLNEVIDRLNIMNDACKALFKDRIAISEVAKDILKDPIFKKPTPSPSDEIEKCKHYPRLNGKCLQCGKMVGEHIKVVCSCGDHKCTKVDKPTPSPSDEIEKCKHYPRLNGKCLQCRSTLTERIKDEEEREVL
jgi:hypothetical protein